jgi:isoleucyl-tRNA synthetase
MKEHTINFESRKIKSSLEAEVELLVPDLEQPSPFIELLQREGVKVLADPLTFDSYFVAENLLRTLFITSDATLIDEGSLGTTSPEWVYVSSVAIPCTCDIVEMVG